MGLRLETALAVGAAWIPLSGRLPPTNVADSKVAPLLIEALPQVVRFVLGDVHGEELLEFVYNFEQLLHCGVDSLKVVSTDADLGRPSRVQGELDPSNSAARLYLLVPIADDHLRIEALKLLFERLDRGALHLGVWAQDPQTSRDHLPVGSIVVLEGHQYAYVRSYLSLLPIETISRLISLR